MNTFPPRFLKLLQETKQRIQEITVQELKTKLDQNHALYLIDIREANELANGYIPSAIYISKGLIELKIESKIPDVNAEIVVYCAGGLRGALVADTLQTMGYTNISSLEGGLNAWITAGFPVVK